jgi:hypothetical protein
MHCGDDRLLSAEQPVALDIEMLHRLGAVEIARLLSVVFEHRAVAEIGAGAERLALRRQHDGAHVGIPIEGFENRGEFLDQRDIEEIVRRAPDLDQRDMTGFFDANITHCSFSS